MRFLHLTLLATAIALSASCATKFEAADAARVNSIAISRVAEPKYYAASYFVARRDEVTPAASADFNSLMEGQNLRLGAELAAGVGEALRKNGYAVTQGDGRDGDAVLDLTVGGFLPDQLGPTYAAHGAQFEPEFMMRARLTDAKTKKTLFSQFYLVANNSLKPMDGTILVEPDSKFYVSSTRDLFEKPDIAAAGFRSAIPLLAQQIAQALKKNP